VLAERHAAERAKAVDVTTKAPPCLPGGRGQPIIAYVADSAEVR